MDEPHSQSDPEAATAGSAVLSGYVYGLALEVRLPPQAVNPLKAALPVSWKHEPAAAPDLCWELSLSSSNIADIHLGGVLVSSSARLSDALDLLAHAIEHEVAQSALGVTFIHAGAVDVDGRALILPGRSFAGKSTLTRALVDRGARYLSDEYAVLSAGGTVRPYRRPMRLRGHQTAPEGEVMRSGGLPDDGKEVPLGVVAVITFQPRASGLHLRALTPGQTAAALLDNALGARRRPAQTLDLVAAAASHALGVVGVRGDASDTADALLAQLGELQKQDLSGGH